MSQQPSPIYAGGPFGMMGALAACIALPVAAAAGWVIVAAYTVVLLAVGLGPVVLVYTVIFSVPLLIFTAVVVGVVYQSGFSRGVGLTLTPVGILEWRAPLRNKRIKATSIQRVDAALFAVRIHHSKGVLRCSAMLAGLEQLLYALRAYQPHLQYDLSSVQWLLSFGRSASSLAGDQRGGRVGAAVLLVVMALFFCGGPLALGGLGFIRAVAEGQIPLP